MRSYDIGLSAINTHQRTLSVIGNNIANSATPGYHRQKVHLVPRAPALDGSQLIGTGVEIADIERVTDVATEDAILKNDAMRGLVSEELSVASDVESLFVTGDSSIHTYFSEFFNSMEAVANQPEQSTVRRELIASGQQLMYQFRNIQDALVEQSDSRLSTVSAAVDEMNGSLGEIADLNREIRIARATNRETGDLLDRRDTKISDLSEFTEIAVHQDSYGRDVVVVGGGVVSVGEVASQLELREGPQGWGVFVDGASHELSVPSGRIRGLLNSVNETIPETVERLEKFAKTIVRAVDQQHAQGLTRDGAFTSLTSLRGVNNTQASLTNAGLEFPVTRGELTMTVTDGDTGNRTSHRIQYDPSADSLTDIVAKFDAVDGVSAYVEEATGELTVSGNGNNRIDFAGRTDNVPDQSNYTGTSPISLGGDYTGTVNDEFTVAFSGAGTIGVTDGLTATITNDDGEVVATVEVGNGYEPGTAIAIGNGLSLELGSGTVAATDTVSIQTTANSDTGGLLAALGINSLFQGENIANFEIRSDIQESPDLFAMSSSGNSGESSNAAAMANLRDVRFEDLNDNRFIEELADFTAESGVETVNLQNQMDQLDAYGQRLSEQQASVSGVNVEEEFLQMLEVERAFQAAARFLSTFDSTVDEIFRILG